MKERQTHIQTERERKEDRDKQAKGETQTGRHRHRRRETYAAIESNTGRERQKWRDTQLEREAERKRDRQNYTDRQTDRGIQRERERRTDQQSYHSECEHQCHRTLSSAHGHKHSAKYHSSRWEWSGSIQRQWAALLNN